MGKVWEWIKGIGSKVVKGIKKAKDWLHEKIRPIIPKIKPFVAPVGTLIGGAFGHPEAGMKAAQIFDKVDQTAQRLGI